MPMPRNSQATTNVSPIRNPSFIRRPAALVAIVLALLAGSLAIGGTSVRAQSVNYTLTTTNFVAAGGTLVINVTTPGVTITSATTPIPSCPQTLGVGNTSVTYSCQVTSTGLPQNTQLGLTFFGTTGAVTVTVTYNANGPFSGSAGVAAATPVSPINCPNLSAAGSEPCTTTTTTQIVPTGDLVVTIAGAVLQLVSITSPGPIGPCQPSSTASTSLAPTTSVTYTCTSGQSIASGTPIMVNVSTNNSGQPTIALNQNANAPLAGAPAIPAPIGPTTITLGAASAVLTGINPGSGAAGATIVLTGTNLTGITAVDFAGAQGTIVSCNLAGTSCTVTAPSLPTGTAAQVTVSSPGGQSNSVTFTYGAGTPPIVTFISPPTSGTPGQAVTFGANATTSSPCGTISSYSYNFGDGTAPLSSSLSNQSHTYAVPGTYTVTLTVTDCAGGIGTASSAITIGQAVSGNSVSYGIGWNIVAGPPNMTVTGSTLPLYTYQINDTAYEMVNSQTGLRPGFGYWAYFPVATSVTVPTTSPSTVSVPLGAGQWTMVGNPGSGVATVTGVDILYTYTAATGYVAATSLNPGQGGWAFSNAGGSATITGR